MEITTTSNGSTTAIALTGWLDTRTAPDLSAELKNLPADCTELVFDLEKLEYISSAGLRLLVTAHKQMSGHFTIVHVSPEIMQVLHMAGFDKRLNIA